MDAFAFDIVIPTIGRPSLAVLCASLARAHGPLPERIIIVDDRPQENALDISALGELAQRASVVRSGGHGPAAARNAGWQTASAPWIAFLDDDVVVSDTWFSDLQTDLHVAGDAAAVQGSVRVPMPADRAPNDWERNVRGLETSAWITADMAYRRSALEKLAGFDERFKRAFREDADIALRAIDAGLKLTRGNRRIDHPVRPADRFVSIRMQAGNGDDVLMEALHGADWYERADAPRGRFWGHVLTVGCAALTLAGALARRRTVATAGFLAWLGLTGEFTANRILPGPRDVQEIATMAMSSAAIPFAAVFHRLRTRTSLERRLAEPRFRERRVST